MPMKLKKVSARSASPRKSKRRPGTVSGIFVETSYRKGKKTAQRISVALEAVIAGERLSLGDIEIIIEPPPTETGGGRETVTPGITITAPQPGAAEN